MIIKAIVMPTPSRIKKKIKNISKDEIFMYSLIGAGIGLISLTESDVKKISIFGLMYCGFSYRFLKNVDDETLSLILQNYDLNRSYFHFRN